VDNSATTSIRKSREQASIGLRNVTSHCGKFPILLREREYPVDNLGIEVDNLGINFIDNRLCG